MPGITRSPKTLMVHDRKRVAGRVHVVVNWRVWLKEYTLVFREHPFGNGEATPDDLLHFHLQEVSHRVHLFFSFVDARLFAYLKDLRGGR